MTGLNYSLKLELELFFFDIGEHIRRLTKLDKRTRSLDRGFGLVRIDAIVERLDGYISRNSEDGAFTTEILLPQE